MSKNTSRRATIGIEAAKLGSSAASAIAGVVGVPKALGDIDAQLAELIIAERDLLQRRIFERAVGVQTRSGQLSVQTGGALQGRSLALATLAETTAAARETSADVLATETRIKEAASRAAKMRQQVRQQAFQGLINLAAVSVSSASILSDAAAQKKSLAAAGEVLNSAPEQQVIDAIPSEGAKIG